MKRDNKKALYESIMTSVAKEVKKVLNEAKFSKEDSEKILNHESISSDLFNIMSSIWRRINIKELSFDKEIEVTYYKKMSDIVNNNTIVGYIIKCDLCKGIFTLKDNTSIHIKSLSDESIIKL